MKAFLLLFALFAGQMNTLQDKPVVRLRPHQDSIPVEFGGNMLVLTNGPSTVHLPSTPPTLDSSRRPWAVSVKNLGPGPVTVFGKAQFSVRINADQMVVIKSDGANYSASH